AGGTFIRDPNNRVLPGILAAPTLAHLQGSSQLDIVVSSLDRHVYAFTPTGGLVPGWPVLVVDPSKVQSVDPTTNIVRFTVGSAVKMGTQLLHSPAVGSLNGGTRPPSPALADLNGKGQLQTAAMTSVGPGYILNPDGSSYLGKGPDGAPLTTATGPNGPLSNSDSPVSIPALGMPIFAPLGPAAPGISM